MLVWILTFLDVVSTREQSWAGGLEGDWPGESAELFQGRSPGGSPGEASQGTTDASVRPALPGFDQSCPLTCRMVNSNKRLLDKPLHFGVVCCKSVSWQWVINTLNQAMAHTEANGHMFVRPYRTLSDPRWMVWAENGAGGVEGGWISALCLLF